MKTKEEILKTKWTANHYAVEAVEMRGIVLYAEQKALEAMDEFAEHRLAEAEKEGNKKLAIEFLIWCGKNGWSCQSDNKVYNEYEWSFSTPSELFELFLEQKGK